MNCIKKKIFIGMFILFTLLSIIGFIIIQILFIPGNIKIIFENKTDFNIDNLKLYLNLDRNSREIDDIPTIQSNSSLKYKLILDDDFSEGRLEMFYKDLNNKLQTDILIGYLEKGYRATVYITITNEANDLKFEIKDKII